MPVTTVKHKYKTAAQKSLVDPVKVTDRSKMSHTSLQIDQFLWKQVKLHCTEQDITCVEFTSDALREKLARAKK